MLPKERRKISKLIARFKELTLDPDKREGLEKEYDMDPAIFLQVDLENLMDHCVKRRCKYEMRKYKMELRRKG